MPPRRWFWQTRTGPGLGSYGSAYRAADRSACEDDLEARRGCAARLLPADGVGPTERGVRSGRQLDWLAGTRVRFLHSRGFGARSFEKRPGYRNDERIPRGGYGLCGPELRGRLRDA